MNGISDEVLDALAAQHQQTLFGQTVLNYKAFARAVVAATRPAMTDDRIDAVADLVIRGMPDGVRGFCKSWGWQQFARALLECCGQRVADAGHPPECSKGAADATRDGAEIAVLIDELRGAEYRSGMHRTGADEAEADAAARRLHAALNPAPDRSARRLAGIWRYGAAVLPKAKMQLDAWLVLLDSALDAAATIPGGFRPDDTADRQPLTRAASDVMRERARQIHVERWTPGHDDDYTGGTLAQAGACYALAAVAEQPGCSESRARNCRLAAADYWPLESNSWKPGSARRMLVKAAALLLAEIERIDRRDGTHAADAS
jgi:hypothetical protein